MTNTGQLRKVTVYKLATRNLIPGKVVRDILIDTTSSLTSIVHFPVVLNGRTHTLLRAVIAQSV
jgi:hypothetical protein